MKYTLFFRQFRRLGGTFGVDSETRLNHWPVGACCCEASAETSAATEAAEPTRRHSVRPKNKLYD